MAAIGLGITFLYYVCECVCVCGECVMNRGMVPAFLKLEWVRSELFYFINLTVLNHEFLEIFLKIILATLSCLYKTPGRLELDKSHSLSYALFYDYAKKFVILVQKLRYR